MKPFALQRLTENQLSDRGRQAVDPETLAKAALIVGQVRTQGVKALRLHAERLGDLVPGAPLVVPRDVLERALAELPMEQRDLLLRTAGRIREFAEAQRSCLRELVVDIPGGQAGHSLAAVASAGCYAPGGRFPLPSSVLMTAVTARAAGVAEVWVASPRPTAITLAAAAVAKADGLLAVGGAQAIAALAYGAGEVPACDAVVGPGNRWVTAAKQLVAGQVAIDMLAGPSELIVLADAAADPDLVAADLLAQAEHDPDALPILVSLDAGLVDQVEAALAVQLVDLPTRANAQAALKNGFCVLVDDLESAVRVCDRLAPEHLELHVQAPETLAVRLRNFGALFVGDGAAEVLGDYGAGPNHVLPTGSTSRFTGGLSVLTFLRTRTWMRMDDLAAAAGLVEDAQALAQLEGLEAHARAAGRRRH